MATSALMESEPAMALQERARKALDEARAAARRQEQQAAAGHRKAELLGKQRLDAALKEHVEAWAARLGTTVSDWPTPTHTVTQTSLWESSHSTNWVTANFFADGIKFVATLLNGQFTGVRLYQGADTEKSKRIESLLDLGEELDRVSKKRGGRT
jgi:hypothetical protein